MNGVILLNNKTFRSRTKKKVSSRPKTSQPEKPGPKHPNLLILQPKTFVSSEIQTKTQMPMLSKLSPSPEAILKQNLITLWEKQSQIQALDWTKSIMISPTRATPWPIWKTKANYLEQSNITREIFKTFQRYTAIQKQKVNWTGKQWSLQSVLMIDRGVTAALRL